MLGQLSPLDAQILMLIDTKEFKNWETDSQKPMHQRVRWSAETVIKLAKEDLGNIDAGQVRLSLENLERLGICVDETLAYELGNYVDSSPGLVITKFGRRFLSACMEAYWRDQFDEPDEVVYQRILKEREEHQRVVDEMFRVGTSERLDDRPVALG